MNSSSSSSDSRRRFVRFTGSSMLLASLGAPVASLAAASGGMASGTVGASASDTAPESAFEPRRGQSGKDVIWIPSPDKLVHRMLSLAAVQPSDYLIDLGSGDGKIVIAAARDFGAKGLGIEYNPDMVTVSQRNAKAAGVSDRARFEKADIFETDFSAATVVTMYLLPHLNMKLRHQLLALKPGTRVVSHEFRMGDWIPDETSRIGSASAHLWLVPANAGGEWQLRFPQRKGEASVKVNFEQTFQTLRGRAYFADFETTLREPRLHGERVRFAFTDEDGALRQFDGRVSGNTIAGTVYAGASAAGTNEGGSATEGRSAAPFTAERTGAPPDIRGAEPASMSEING
jgi:hypothetical protein